MSDESTLFGPDEDQQLIAVYQTLGRTLDDLPYTETFEQLYAAVGGEESEQITRANVLRRLHNLRKAGKLPRLGRAASTPAKVDPEAEQRLEQLTRESLGGLGRRDQLPYTETFDRIVNQVNSEVGMNLTPHDAWRVIARLAK